MIWDDDDMMMTIVGICALLIGFVVGFALRRQRPSKNAAVRRELRDIRATTAGTNADLRPHNPYHTQPQNPGSSGVNPF
jgi:hypothetical protein